ncbi:MAG TPA: hypothetical protein PLJ21_08980 [Pseudobdellovibrionaceae bacterium]|nr:hypothetical protein [Pseudobdellovibrionaceae bacterium]
MIVKNFILIFFTFSFLNIPLSFSAEPIERILCLNSEKEASEVLTFPTDAFENYKPRSFTLFDARGKIFFGLNNPQTILSRPTNISFLIESKEPKKINLLKVDAQISQGKATSEKIFEIPLIQNSITFIYSALNLPEKNYHYQDSTQTLLIPDSLQPSEPNPLNIQLNNKLLKYKLISMKSDKSDESEKSIVLPNQYIESINPLISPLERFIKFEVLDRNSNLLRGLLFDQKNKSFLTLPNPQNIKTHQIEIYFLNEEILTWTEVGPSEKGFFSVERKVARLSDLSKTMTSIYKEKAQKLRMSIVSMNSSGHILHTQSFEQFEITNTNDGTRERILKEAHLSLTEFSISQFQKLSTVDVLYPEFIFNITQKYFNLGPLLSNPLNLESKNKLAFSFGSLGGFISLDLGTKNWQGHAISPNAFYKCFQAHLSMDSQDMKNTESP